MAISVKCIEMVAGVSRSGGQGTVGGFDFSAIFLGSYAFAVVFGSVQYLTDLELDLVKQTFSFLISFSNSLFPLLQSFVSSNGAITDKFFCLSWWDICVR